MLIKASMFSGSLIAIHDRFQNMSRVVVLHPSVVSIFVLLGDYHLPQYTGIFST